MTPSTPFKPITRETTETRRFPPTPLPTRGSASCNPQGELRPRFQEYRRPRWTSRAPRIQRLTHRSTTTVTCSNGTLMSSAPCRADGLPILRTPLIKERTCRSTTNRSTRLVTIILPRPRSNMPLRLPLTEETLQQRSVRHRLHSLCPTPSQALPRQAVRCLHRQPPQGNYCVLSRSTTVLPMRDRAALAASTIHCRRPCRSALMAAERYWAPTPGQSFLATQTPSRHGSKPAAQEGSRTGTICAARNLFLHRTFLNT